MMSLPTAIFGLIQLYFHLRSKKKRFARLLADNTREVFRPGLHSSARKPVLAVGVALYTKGEA